MGMEEAMIDLLKVAGVMSFFAIVSWYVWVLTTASSQQVLWSTLALIAAIVGLAISAVIALLVKVLLEKMQSRKARR
jgi:apolipoprotein N-acyltransferase